MIYYYNNITDLVNFNSTKSSYINVGRAVIQGVTTTYDGSLFGLNVLSSIDYQNAENEDPKSVVNAGGGNVLAYHPYVFGSLTVEKSVTDWKLGVQMQAQGNQQTNPGVTTGGNKNTTLGGYALFNLYGNIKIYKDVSLFARLNNVLNKDYVNTVSGTASYNNSAYSTAGSNIFVGLRFDQR